MTRLSDERLINLFHEPHTVSSLHQEPSPTEQLRRASELTFYGPTAFNGQPLPHGQRAEAHPSDSSHLADSSRLRPRRHQSPRFSPQTQTG